MDGRRMARVLNRHWRRLSIRWLKNKLRLKIDWMYNVNNYDESDFIMPFLGGAQSFRHIVPHILYLSTNVRVVLEIISGIIG
jgi:hypothetical protein